MSLRILNLAQGQDTGGQIFRAARAFDRHSEHTMRAIVSSSSYLAYPREPYIEPWDLPTVEAAWRESDVIHIHNHVRPFWPLWRKWHRPIVVTFHGSYYRGNSARLNAEMGKVGARGAVTTVDLLPLGDYRTPLTWLPSLYDLDELAAYRRGATRDPSSVTIAHAPTSRKAKGTELVIAAIRTLSARRPITFDLIEGVTWAECLERKARADIFVDQLLLGYGGNAVEAWAMGIPVVVGLPDWTAALLSGLTDPLLPFVRVNPLSSLDHVLDELAADPRYRTSLGLRGRVYAKTYHSERSAIARYETLYLEATA